MSLARLVITAVTVEGRSLSSVARDYDLSRVWVQKLVHRYQREGPVAFEPRSRRPHTNPRAVDLEVEDRIVRLRKTLTKKGVDAGAETIAAHLATAGVLPVPAVSTIWRILSRRGFVTPQPQKRPRSSWRRFAADQPNERWQTDITHWHLADGTEVEILNILDDLPGSASPRPPAGYSPDPRSGPASPPLSAGGVSRPRCCPTFKLGGALNVLDRPAGGVRIEGSGTRSSSLLDRSKRLRLLAC